MRHHVVGPGRRHPARLVRWPWRVARTIRDGGPSRVVPMRQPRITGYDGRSGCCVIRRAHRSTPKAVGRVSPTALSAREILKGQPSGGHMEQASNTARGTPEVPADLRRYRQLAGSTGPKGPIARHATGLPWCREALRFVGPKDPGVPRALIPSRASDANRTTGEPGARSNNTGGGALAWSRGWRSGGVRFSLRSSPRKRGPSAKRKVWMPLSRARTERPILASRSLCPLGRNDGRGDDIVENNRAAARTPGSMFVSCA